MVLDAKERLNGDGDAENIQENEEELKVAWEHLSKLTRQDSAGLTFGKQEMSLMQKILSTGSEAYKEEQLWRMCNFLDQDEALDHVAAYYEAKELGMDTGFNIAFAFALVSANRRTSGTNLLAMLLDTLQHGKWAGNNQSKRNRNDTTSRSPLSE